MKTKRNVKDSVSLDEQKRMLCDNLSFAGAEAYKLLRTNILFSFPEEKKCKIIGVTSSMRGEGKSFTSINLAYSLAQMGKTVLLLEADMRLPNIAKRLGLNATPGLSDLLVGTANGEEVLQHVGRFIKFFAITAGNVPPNPSELLGSARMQDCVLATADSFEYVIIDLPPVNVVSDALALSKMIDGYVFVVRQDYATRQSVTEAMNKMSIVEAKVLGFVMNAVGSGGKSYGYRKGSRYGYDYGKYYGASQHKRESSKNQGKA